MKQNTYHSHLMYLHLFQVTTIWSNPKDPEWVFVSSLLGHEDVFRRLIPRAKAAFHSDESHILSYRKQVYRLALLPR